MELTEAGMFPLFSSPALEIGKDLLLLKSIPVRKMEATVRKRSSNLARKLEDSNRTVSCSIYTNSESKGDENLEEVPTRFPIRHIDDDKLKLDEYMVNTLNNLLEDYKEYEFELVKKLK
ncbi:4466_t:CDS:2, partial [Diversispora eburnea]